MFPIQWTEAAEIFPKWISGKNLNKRTDYNFDSDFDLFFSNFNVCKFLGSWSQNFPRT